MMSDHGAAVDIMTAHEQNSMLETPVGKEQVFVCGYAHTFFGHHHILPLL